VPRSSLAGSSWQVWRDGKQTGFLRLPHPVRRSAYGWVPIPIGAIRIGDGPIVRMMAGNHGDE